MNTKSKILVLLGLIGEISMKKYIVCCFNYRKQLDIQNMTLIIAYKYT